jgi:hypothetical protein
MCSFFFFESAASTPKKITFSLLCLCHSFFGLWPALTTGLVRMCRNTYFVKTMDVIILPAAPAAGNMQYSNRQTT